MYWHWIQMRWIHLAVEVKHKGMIVNPHNPLRWFPSFRIEDSQQAMRINVGSILKSELVGPLHYRADAYQITFNGTVKFEPSSIKVTKSKLTPGDHWVTILTLNGFNLDVRIERPDKVQNPNRDVDDDWGDGRFHMLSKAIVNQANIPDIIALQEIQDNDGAEKSDVVDASHTFALLVKSIEKVCAVRYRWVDVNPENGADGGQPGGNIRNGYLYNPARVSLVKESVQAIGHEEPAFTGSRKPLLASFKERASGKIIACISVHLASKRHQNSIFAPIDPGVDAKLAVRVAQAARVREEIIKLREQGVFYYVTGDFNDTEFSPTLLALLGKESINLVQTVPENERYDYNFRGQLQVLMHGIIDKDSASQAEYEIIHGNELLGVTPGRDSSKPSDHAYVIAKLRL